MIYFRNGCAVNRILEEVSCSKDRDIFVLPWINGHRDTMLNMHNDKIHNHMKTIVQTEAVFFCFVLCCMH